MAVARASEDFAVTAQEVNQTLDGVRGDSAGGWEVADAKAYASDLAKAARMMQQLNRFTDRVSTAAMRIITMSKARAETRSKMAELKAMEQFSILAVGIKGLIWDLLSEEDRVVFESRVRRELFLPANIEPPAELGGRGSSVKGTLDQRG